MLKFLKGVVGSGGGIKDLPYNLGDAYSEAWGAWTHYRGTSKVRCGPLEVKASRRFGHRISRSSSCISHEVTGSRWNFVGIEEEFSRCLVCCGTVHFQLRT